MGCRKEFVWVGDVNGGGNDLVKKEELMMDERKDTQQSDDLNNQEKPYTVYEWKGWPQTRLLAQHLQIRLQAWDKVAGWQVCCECTDAL